MPNEAQVLELDDIKTRQQAVWTSGDYAAVAARIVIIAEQLVEAADLRAGARVLDVAAGSGNATLAPARRNCDVVGVDYAHRAAGAGPPARRSRRSRGRLRHR